MKLKTNSGILYPENPQIQVLHSGKNIKLPAVEKVPHASWSKIKKELDDIFYNLSDSNPEYVFVLAPLHKGKINKDDSYTVFTYEDCFVSNSILEKDSEVCSEEYSYEILLPYLEAYFPNAKKTAFFAPGQPDRPELLIDFVKSLKEEYPQSLFLLSGTANCCSMWYQAIL